MKGVFKKTVTVKRKGMVIKIKNAIPVNQVQKLPNTEIALPYGRNHHGTFRFLCCGQITTQENILIDRRHNK